MAETTAAGWAAPLEPAGLQAARVATRRAWVWRAAMLAAAVVAVRLGYGVLLANSAAIADVAARGPRWGFVAAAVALFLANQIITLVRWRWLARAAGVPVTVSDAFTLMAAAEVGNLVMPGANGSDAVKLGMIARQRLPRGYRFSQTLAIVTLVAGVGLFRLAQGRRGRDSREAMPE
jgi:uncharacterized membrane protein YbhN (UPF0104 family)